MKKDQAKMLRVGDTVLYSTDWSKDEPRTVVVNDIEVGCRGSEFGWHVLELSWDEVHARGNCVLDLSDGHWAYGYQIRPLQ